MGIMQPYFPTEIAIKLANIANANIFIETGTYMGSTSKWASTQFKKVHTIELSEFIYNQIKDDLLQMGNITPHFGDSRDVLPNILANIINENIIFWLDGHYSAGITAGKDSPCPLLKELDIILSRSNDDIIIIDDARCLMGGEGWPSIFELNKKVESAIEKRFMIICDDNLYIVPNNYIYNHIIHQFDIRLIH